MGEKTSNLTLRLPPEVHQKLKVMAALGNKSMTDVIIDMVGKVKLKTPAFMDPVGAKKKAAPQGRISTEEEVKPIIMDLKGRGLSLQKICDELIAQGLPTMSGKGGWKKGSLSRMIQRWDAEK